MLKLKKNYNNISYRPEFFYDNKFYIGHLLKRWNVFMQFYILYKNKNYYLFNLYKTINNLKRSIFFIINVILNRGKVLLIDATKAYRKLFFFFQKITFQTFF